MKDDRIFVDTNIFIYAALKEDRDGDKGHKAIALLQSLSDKMVFINTQVLNEIRESVRENSIIISLAPKISIAKIQNEIPRAKKIVRMIPNAPSYINEGYNPINMFNAIAVTETA